MWALQEEPGWRSGPALCLMLAPNEHWDDNLRSANRMFYCSPRWRWNLEPFRRRLTRNRNHPVTEGGKFESLTPRHTKLHGTGCLRGGRRLNDCNQESQHNGNDGCGCLRVPSGPFIDLAVANKCGQSLDDFRGPTGGLECRQAKRT